MYSKCGCGHQTQPDKEGMIFSVQPPDLALIGTASDAAGQPGVHLHEALCQNEMEEMQTDTQICFAWSYWMVLNTQIKTSGDML